MILYRFYMQYRFHNKRDYKHIVFVSLKYMNGDWKKCSAYSTTDRTSYGKYIV